MKNYLVCIIVALASSTTWAEAIALNLHNGSLIEGPVLIGKTYIPLPKGEWEVIETKTRELRKCASSTTEKCLASAQSTIGAQITIQLARKTKEKQVSSIITIDAPLEYIATMHKLITSTCDSTSGYYFDRFNSGYDLPECLKVRTYPAKSWIKYFKKNNTTPPTTLLRAQYFKATSKGYYDVSIYFNPHIAGFNNEKYNDTEDNPWEESKLDENQIKFKFNLIEWSTAMSNSMKNSITNRINSELDGFGNY